jgi:PASTA domain/IPT/TIG domain
MAPKARTGFASVLASVVCLLIAAGAADAQITIGQTVRVPYTLLPCSGEEIVPTSIAAGTGYVAPATGVITSWSTTAGPAPGQVMGLKVFRPLGGLSFQVAGQDVPRPLLPGQRNTHPVAIPVQAGDILGLFVPVGGEAECVFGQTGSTADFYRYNQGNSPNGAVVAFSPGLFGTEERPNIEASLLPPPAIASLSSTGGPIKNAALAIAGANFAAVSGVSFGGIPAKSFTVDSEGQITALAPDSAQLSTVAVSVTTAAGAATSAQTFTYEGCKVPKLKGNRLKASKKRARKADCRIGKVKKLGDATAKTGKVVRQRPKPGKILLPGTKIRVSLGD